MVPQDSYAGPGCTHPARSSMVEVGIQTSIDTGVCMWADVVTAMVNGMQMLGSLSGTVYWC
jgi:hypothetical protein